ncbi:uncharacterized protein ATNIH1004_000541 [Aspergillus tanneri]|uniref:GAT domain-containing protein n=1 Tax=Aspergillus tanneri TaxID=1220188 RepID=A0A5M9N1X5_9EURO|nr:uncharacterized protein ATNIH1004_000541 [Aspergillus tanneri]KAA8651650.1 hypothetical protein ATNIH1004_000541 [Aspergillus tanneri]
MKRILGSFNKRSTSSSLDSPPIYPADSPEGIILREVNAFCEAGAGPGNSQSTEYVHLPGIVESAESSPNAAREAAHRIRKILSDTSAVAPANMQYNAIMLIRILIDNPGYTFTRNLDAKFAATVKDLLRQGKDPNVQYFLRDTLDTLETQRQWDEDLAVLLQMWRKEKTKLTRTNSGISWRSQPSPQWQNQRPNYFNVRQNSSSLPPPDELVARVSEAKTSAKLLIQFVQSTPPTEILENELIKEFSDRCRVASRAMENYIHSTNPAPDEDTLMTLIETNDELSAALSKHQHALLNARKALGQAGSQSPPSSDEASVSGALRPVPPPPPASQWQAQSPPSSTAPNLAPAVPMMDPAAGIPPSTGNTSRSHEYRSEDFQVQNPFADNLGSTMSPGHAESQQMGGTANEWWNDTQRPIQRTT